MKIETMFHITKSKTTNVWAFMFTPAIYVARRDVFSDEAAYYVGFHWLVFRAFVLIITKK